jgi:hypothetical protein
MASFKPRQLTLTSIHYKGSKLGSEWQIQLSAAAAEITVDAKLKYGKETPLHVPLIRQTVNTASRKSQTVALAITATEIDGPKTSDISETLSTPKVDIKKLGSHLITLDAQGVGVKERKKTAKLTLRFDAIEPALDSLGLEGMGAIDRGVSASYGTDINLIAPKYQLGKFFSPPQSPQPCATLGCKGDPNWHSK